MVRPCLACSERMRSHGHCTKEDHRRETDRLLRLRRQKERQRQPEQDHPGQPFRREWAEEGPAAQACPPGRGGAGLPAAGGICGAGLRPEQGLFQRLVLRPGKGPDGLWLLSAAAHAAGCRLHPGLPPGPPGGAAGVLRPASAGAAGRDAPRPAGPGRVRLDGGIDQTALD